MSEKRTLPISILGKNYSIVTDEDSKLVEDAANLVESSLKPMVSGVSSPADMAKKTTFVALQLAVNLLKQQQELEKACRDLEGKQKELDLIGMKTATLNELLKEA